MAEKPPLMQTATGVIAMHVLPPLVAAGIGAFATITVLTERIATVEIQTRLAQEQIDRRFAGIETTIRDKVGDVIRVVDNNKRDTDRRLDRIEERIWPGTGPL